MSGGRAEWAAHIRTDIDAALPALPPACRVAYLADGPAPALGRAVRALAAGLDVGLSLDYPPGLDPRDSGLAAPDIELEDALLARLAAFAAIARRWDRPLRTVGCHGMLALDVADDERTTQVVARTLQRYDATLSLAVPAGRRGIAVAHHCGIAVVREAWAGAPDRAPPAGSSGRADRYRFHALADTP
ncbi:MULTISPECIES: LamB/YcsF family protein [Bordetella]|uniref:Phosphotransferase n=1 Tax=Bordetella genomosp. 6 TaxID=463024 RepID=A0ABX4FIT8_9BORD|nr:MULTISPECIES: LamB/YcsF family protein [Bordetella]AOB26902.1 hypothetical protein BBB44_12005 [Bordetella bronchiseptica]AZW44214.1 hypothetical protein CWR61_12105 [Bordetella bronchiseptica]OZI82098.1 hypothetical protein CAL23_10520 [Bordetella genomosp. 6]